MINPKYLTDVQNALPSFMQYVIPGLLILFGTIITLLANRKNANVTAKKTETEIDVLQIGAAKTFSEAANQLAQAHLTTETSWKNLLTALASEIDKYKKEKEEWFTEREDYRKKINDLDEKMRNDKEEMRRALDREREECQLSMSKLRMEMEGRLTEDKKWFVDQLTSLAKSK